MQLVTPVLELGRLAVERNPELVLITNLPPSRRVNAWLGFKAFIELTKGKFAFQVNFELNPITKHFLNRPVWPL